jgi:hypothetical protein
MFSNDATVHPWGEEKKKESLWRRVFKRSKPKSQEYVPSPYTPSPFAPSTFERNTAYGVPVYQVPKTVPYDMPRAVPYDIDSSSNSSSDGYFPSRASSYWSSPPQSPISSHTLASSRSPNRASMARSNTGYSSTNSFMPPVEEDQLILTLTSKYPTGIAADLYTPETTIVPQTKSLSRSISNRSYQAKHAIIRRVDRNSLRNQNRQSWHF